MEFFFCVPFTVIRLPILTASIFSKSRDFCFLWGGGVWILCLSPMFGRFVFCGGFRVFISFFFYLFAFFVFFSADFPHRLAPCGENFCFSCRRFVSVPSFAVCAS